jgi:hypothetical protein
VVAISCGPPTDVPAPLGSQTRRPVVSPKVLRERREALIRFNNVYVEYLDETHRNGSADRQKLLRLRAEVIEAMPAAQEGLTTAGVNLTVTPPPLTGGVILRGLPNVAFLHEQPGYRLEEPFGHKPTYANVLDMLRLGTQYLAETERVERRRRRNPLYWIDRVLRTTLGIPAYLVSLVVGVPRRRVEASAFGPLLRAVGVLADFAGVFAIGKLIGLY